MVVCTVGAFLEYFLNYFYGGIYSVCLSGGSFFYGGLYGGCFSGGSFYVYTVGAFLGVVFMVVKTVCAFLEVVFMTVSTVGAVMEVSPRGLTFTWWGCYCLCLIKR